MVLAHDSPQRLGSRHMPADKAYTTTMMLAAVQQLWDFFTSSFNIFASIVQQPLIPLWNSVSQYVVQPMVFITIEIVSMILPPFGDRDVFYALSKTDHERKGFDCYASLNNIADELDRLRLNGCIKERELCLGRCGSDSPNQDFFTLVSKASLHHVHPDYHAYCHSKDLTYDVYLFGPPGTNMRQFAEQMHIRSGLTAFDPSTVTHDVYDDFRNSLEQSDRLTYIPHLGIALSSTLSPRPPGPRRLPFSAQPPFDLHRRRCLR